MMIIMQKKFYVFSVMLFICNVNYLNGPIIFKSVQMFIHFNKTILFYIFFPQDTVHDLNIHFILLSKLYSKETIMKEFRR